MRLQPEQVTAIRAAAAEAFGAGVSVWLFGSRVDDRKRGGDIDLLIRPAQDSTDHLWERKIRMLTRLESLLGERKVDLVIEQPQDERPIVSIALATGERMV